jgi:hypothetical protein
VAAWAEAAAKAASKAARRTLSVFNRTVDLGELVGPKYRKAGH